MSRTINRVWGCTEENFNGCRKDETTGRIIHEEGTNYLRAGQMVPIHVESKFSEDYIPRTAGLKILVVTETEVKDDVMSVYNLLNKLETAEFAEVGQVYKCPKGHAHIAYNPGNTEARFDYVKYDE